MDASYLRATGTITDMIGLEDMGTNGVAFRDLTLVGITGQTNGLLVGSATEIASGLVVENVRFFQHVEGSTPYLHLRGVRQFIQDTVAFDKTIPVSQSLGLRQI